MNEITERSQKILEYVALAKMDLTAKENEHKMDLHLIEVKTSGRIDITTEVGIEWTKDIIKSTQETAKEFYAFNQMTVEKIDMQCRPLLTGGCNHDAVKAVRDLIVKLNDNSEIEVDYNASLNSAFLGTAAEVHFAPSLQSMAIEEFWKSAVSDPSIVVSKEKTPMQNDEKKSESLKKREEYLKKYEEAEAKRIKQEGLSQIENEQLEKEQKEYNAKMAEYNKVKKEIDEKRQKHAKKKEAEYVEKIKNEAKETYDKACAPTTEYISNAESRKSEAKKKLAGLGLFKLSEKKQCKLEIKQLTADIAKARADLDAAESVYRDAVSGAVQKAEESRDKFKKEAEKEYPSPTEPPKSEFLVEMEEKRKKMKEEKRKKAFEREWGVGNNGVLKKAIYDHLGDKKERTRQMIMEELPQLKNSSEQVVSVLLSNLQGEGKIQRKDWVHKYWYYRTDDNSSNASSAESEIGSSSDSPVTYENKLMAYRHLVKHGPALRTDVADAIGESYVAGAQILSSLEADGSAESVSRSGKAYYQATDLEPLKPIPTLE